MTVRRARTQLKWAVILSVRRAPGASRSIRQQTRPSRSVEPPRRSSPRPRGSRWQTLKPSAGRVPRLRTVTVIGSTAPAARGGVGHLHGKAHRGERFLDADSRAVVVVVGPGLGLCGRHVAGERQRSRAHRREPHDGGPSFAGVERAECAAGRGCGPQPVWLTRAVVPRALPPATPDTSTLRAVAWLTLVTSIVHWVESPTRCVPVGAITRSARSVCGTCPAGAAGDGPIVTAASPASSVGSGSAARAVTVARLVSVWPAAAGSGARDLEGLSRVRPERVDPADHLLTADRAAGVSGHRGEPGGQRVAHLHAGPRRVAVVARHQPEHDLAADGDRAAPDAQLLDPDVHGARRERDQVVVVVEVRLEAEDSGEGQRVARQREVGHLGAGAVGGQRTLDRDHAVLARTELGDVADDEWGRVCGADALAGRVVSTDAGPAGD